MQSMRINHILIGYTNNNIKILNSCQVRDENKMRDILERFVLMSDFKSRRSIKSWVLEWKAHNLLYTLHLFRNHTQDCDLEEQISLFHRIIYNILGRIG